MVLSPPPSLFLSCKFIFRKGRSAKILLLSVVHMYTGDVNNKVTIASRERCINPDIYISCASSVEPVNVTRTVMTIPPFTNISRGRRSKRARRIIGRYYGRASSNSGRNRRGCRKRDALPPPPRQARVPGFRDSPFSWCKARPLYESSARIKASPPLPSILSLFSAALRLPFSCAPAAC